MKKVDKKELAGKGKGFIAEFKSFVLRGNVMDMAVGVIIGTAFASIIGALTDDFINPLINGLGGAEIGGRIKIYGGQYLDYGHFLTAVINFLIMAFVLFLMLKFVNKLKRKKAIGILPDIMAGAPEGSVDTVDADGDVEN